MLQTLSLPLLLLASVVAAASGNKFAAAVKPSAAWEHIGPRALGDAIIGDASIGLYGGEAGTLEDAASPVSNPNIIYTGGCNNGAASGVLKSVDMGKTWIRSSNGKCCSTEVRSTRVRSTGARFLFLEMVLC